MRNVSQSGASSVGIVSGEQPERSQSVVILGSDHQRCCIAVAVTFETCADTELNRRAGTWSQQTEDETQEREEQ